MGSELGWFNLVEDWCRNAGSDERFSWIVGHVLWLKGDLISLRGFCSESVSILLHAFWGIGNLSSRATSCCRPLMMMHWRCTQADIGFEDGGFGGWGRRAGNSENSANGGPCDHHSLFGLVGRVFLPLTPLI